MSAADVFQLLDGPLPRWGEDDVSEVLAAEYGLTGTLHRLAGERDLNFLLDGGAGRFTVKVANAMESPEVLSMQQAALAHLHGRLSGLATAEPVASLGGELVVSVDRGGDRYAVRVQRHLEGTLLRDAVPGSIAAHDVGVAVARLQVALQGFFHPAAGRRLAWDARTGPELLSVIDAIPDLDVRSAVADRVAHFRDQVAARLAALPAQVIHNDMNPDNLVVADGGITGVIDFGDMVHGPRVMDLAVAAAYQVPASNDPGRALTDICAGYESLLTLSDAEKGILLDLVVMRLCQSIAIGAWHARRHPENAEYILGDAQSSRDALAALADITWPSIPSSSELMARRSYSIAPGLRLSYNMPIHLVSGEGVWVRDAAGRTYLDAYNNVVQVGHGHPGVVRALAGQARRLNTNTRYLTDALVEYAEKLTSLLPDGLDVCYFTNSGSEANDLAWRIARAVTGNGGAIVTEFAYHGSTTTIAAISPEEWGDRPLEPWVATVPPPAGASPSVERAVGALAARGFRPAAVMLDTIFSSDGVFDPSAEYLDAAAAGVRGAGGLYIADEVQAGLGRVGERMWGFAAGTSVPDIVTLGKPIGNGHPIGAVVMSRSLADRFAARDYFFSTFGGNTVSAAVGMAVLDITERDALPDSSERVGSYLRESIRALDEDRFREVRGAGLFIGVEVVDADGVPDGEGARAIVEVMKQRGVLIGRTGRHDNVLKVRPPLVFQRDHADRLLEALQSAVG